MPRGFLLTRNALDPTDATVRKDYTTATPATVTGKPGSNLILEPVGATTAFNSAAPSDSGVLVRLGATRHVGAAAALGHNLNRHDCWRLAAGTDERPAQRPVWTTDGVDDLASTSEAIPDTADLTILAVVRLPPQGVGLETAEGSLIRLRNALGGDRVHLVLRAGTAGTPYALKLRFYNFSTNVEINPAAIYAEGQWVCIGIRYIDSTTTFSLWWNGVKLADGTASAAWVSKGSTALYLSRSHTGSDYAAVEWMSCAVYNDDLSDAAMAAWTGDILEGNETTLAFGCNFTAGTGSTGTDVTGNANLTLTGGTWAQRVSPYALHTEDRAVWGPWSSRQGVKLATATSIASPVISAAPRSVTLAFSFVWPADTPAVSGGGAGPYIGPAFSTALLRFEFTSGGFIRARAQRGGNVTVTSTTVCKDGAVRYARATINGHTKKLTLYIAAAGSAEASEGTPATVGAHATLASCKLGIGDGSATQPGAIVSDVRAYSRVALEATAPMGSDAPAWQLVSMWAHTRLDGQVVDGVGVTRSYTGTSGLTYKRMYRTDAHGALEAADARLHASGDDPFRSYPRRLLADFGADLAISELYLQVDRRDGSGDATNGYAELGTLYAPATVRPPDGLLSDGRRHPSVSVPATRTKLGAVYGDTGYAADAVTVDVIRHAGRVAPVPTTVTAEEIERQVFALPDWASRLRGVWLDPSVAAHRYVEQVVIGYLSGSTSSREARDVAFDSWRIEIVGVWPLIG